jgi:hypothetical protein
LSVAFHDSFDTMFESPACVTPLVGSRQDGGFAFWSGSKIAASRRRSVSFR